MNPQEVWVTGAGVICAAGAGLAPLRELLTTSRSAMQYDRTVDCATGRIEAFQPTPTTRRLDRSAQLFFAAAEDAWADSDLDEERIDPRRTAVIEGSSLGPLGELLGWHRHLIKHPERPVRPSQLVRFMTGAGGVVMAQTHGIRGPVLHLSAASVSALCAIGEACEKIRTGIMDVVVAGGAECPLDPEVVDTFRAAGILSHQQNGEAACRPFDERRSGTALGEGAGVLILESAAHAAARGVRPRARISGFGLACERVSLTGPDPSGSGVSEAVTIALEASSRSDLAWIKTHGTGTIVNDAAECAGLARVFGDRLREIPITSLKSTLGHCLGASGAVEAVATVLCVEEAIIPATFGTTKPDPAFPPCTVATAIRENVGPSVLLLAESFGGRCAAMVMN